MTRIVAVRHGETDWNRNGRVQGWAPVPLNETGREQATAAGEYLADAYDIDRVLSSDLLRTRQTTECILAAVGERPVEYEPDWRERHLGVYQGLTYDDIGERFPEFGLGETAYRATTRTPEAGESLRAVADRVTDRFDRLLEGADGETILVVTHGGPIRVLMGHAKEMALSDAFVTHSQDNCAVNELRAGPGGVRVVRENATEWAR
jgi:probable phosphoglycerate mutase